MDKLQKIWIPWWKSKPSLATSPPGEVWPLRFGSETVHWYSHFSPWVSSLSPPFCPLLQPHSLGPTSSYSSYNPAFSSLLSLNRGTALWHSISPGTLSGSMEAKAGHIPGFRVTVFFAGTPSCHLFRPFTCKLLFLMEVSALKRDIFPDLSWPLRLELAICMCMFIS